ncbi:MAG: DUF2490 domain-containing protein [Bacteroidota bacterium]|nr:DUF2490 domain-containing protein [Bacteroidota bacterium]
MTIRPGTYFLSCFFLFFIAAIDLQAQVKDFQTWWEVELDKQLTGKLDLSGEFEQRFKNNSLQYNRTLLTLVASYDVLDYLRMAGGGRVIFVMNREQQLRARYRFHFDLTGRYDLSGFRFSLRSRLQYGFDDVMAFRYLKLNSFVNRNRLKLAYHIFGTKFDCFALLESWHGSDRESHWRTFAMRYSAGVRYSVNFHSRFSLRYILEDEFNVVNPLQLHVLVMGYSYSF